MGPIPKQQMIIQRTPFFTTKRFDDLENKRIDKKNSDRVFLIKKRAYCGIPKIDGNIPTYIANTMNLNRESIESVYLTLSSYPWMWNLLIEMTINAKNNRIIIAPSDKKKALQEETNRRLSAIRSHPSVFGFVKGRSALDCAKAHTDFHGGKMGLLIKMDISNFFNSFSEGMIEEALMHHGFNERERQNIISESMMDVFFQSRLVKDILKELMRPTLKASAIMAFEATHKICPLEALAEIYLYAASTAGDEISEKEFKDTLFSKGAAGSCKLHAFDRATIREALRRLLKCGPNTGFGQKMLFQGGPSSPFLSNMGFKRWDYNLDAYARTCGGFYTRYADDMCFSFKERRTTKNINLFIHGITKIVQNAGFVVNKDKTSVIGSGRAQKIVGYCVNSGSPTIPQSYRKMVHQEIASSVRKADPLIGSKIRKMEGMIAYIETANPEAAVKLRKELDQINQQKHSKRKIEI